MPAVVLAGWQLPDPCSVLKVHQLESAGLHFEVLATQPVSLSFEIHQEFSDALEHGDLAGATRLLDRHPELANPAGWTPPPLHCTVLWEQPQLAELLLDRGARIEARDPDRSVTAVEYAVIYCKIRMLKLLLGRGANVTVDSDGQSHLMRMAMKGVAGGYQQYEDLPTPDQYQQTVRKLLALGITR